MNTAIRNWIEEQIELLSPKSVLWIDGSETQLEQLRREACSTGELTRLNQEKAPGCYLYRTAPNDVARMENRTFICSKKEEDAGPSNHWMAPEKAYALLRRIARNSYRDRTMYVIPFSMGPIGSPYARYGVEITDSIYVVLSMAIMTRSGAPALKVLDAPDSLESIGPDRAWVRCLHCKCQVDPEQRYICHFPEDETIISVNSAYGGNVLLGKKCFALRIASHMARREGWLAEHMLILGMQNPNGKITYVAAAFPSACGKTNFAMMIPPEGYRNKGYRIWCVGDDIAWLHIGPDGGLWAINPENGFFGVAPGTNEQSNPNALAATRTGTIFTNVALDLSDDTPWWEGLTKTLPQKALNWLGQPWPETPETAETRGAHPNSRFTSPATNCPCLSDQFDADQGVPISAILFGGRRAKMTPLVYQSFSWEHGVFLGSTMASETTAAATGEVGVIRRDPMAMLPFCGYHMGDYFTHWLKMGEVLGAKAPKIFHVNWFRTDEQGSFLWPGFGENLRVLEWILDRCNGSAHAVTTPIGYLPEAQDLNLEGLNVSPLQMEELLSVDSLAWLSETKDICKFYLQFGDRLPAELSHQLEQLDSRLMEDVLPNCRTA